MAWLFVLYLGNLGRFIDSFEALFNSLLKTSNGHMRQKISTHSYTTKQSTLGFATMGLAANLGIGITALLTDLRQYMIATSGITTSNFDPDVVSEIATVNTFWRIPYYP